VGPSHRPKPLAPRANGVGRFFFSRGLSQPALRVLLPLLPATERGGGRRGGISAISELSGGLLRLLPEVGGGFLTKRFLSAGRSLEYLAQSSWSSAILVLIIFSNTADLRKEKFGEVL
jgi:hypothetical protein